MYCTELFDQPIPYHQINEKDIEKSLQAKIERDALMFANEYETWNVKNDAELRYFICKQGPDYTLNEQELTKLVTKFDNRFEADQLREKVMEYGVQWEPIEQQTNELLPI